MLFPVPTSPMITKWSVKSIESMMEKIGRFGLVPSFAGEASKAGFREGRMPGSSLANLSLGFS